MIRSYLSSLCIAFGVCLSVLSSCSVHSKYVTPDIFVDDLFRDEIPYDSSTIAHVSWRDFFEDPYLLNLIDEGLSNNFDVRIAYTRIRAAESALATARAAFFPNIGLVGQVNETLSSNGTDGKKIYGYHVEEYTLGISASWEADIWGKLRGQSRAQYAAYMGSMAYRDLVTTSLISNIATSYYTLLALDEQLSITEQTVLLLGQTVETMRALLEAGVQNGAAVQQSLSLYYGTMAAIPDIEAQIWQAENALSTLLGRTPGKIERSGLAQVGANTMTEHGVPAQLLTLRPDVRQAEYALISAFELTNSARAALYPSIKLGTGSMAGYGAATLSSFFRPENLLAIIIGQISQPIFYGRQLRGSLEQAEARKQEALLAFEKTVLEAGQEVSDILYSLNSSLSKNPTREKQIEALETSVYFTQELLAAGEANYTEVLTAQQNLLSAQINRVNDRLEQLQYSVQLYRALGGGVF